MTADDAARWALAVQAAHFLAVDPVGLGGATVRAPAGPARDRWLALFRGAISVDDAPAWRRMPPGITEGRLIGGLDLPATLAAGRPVAERGLLAETDGGVLIAPMAERMAAGTAAQVGAALDTGDVILERDGITRRLPARFACLLLDEGIDDERAPPTLSDRLAFRLDLDGLRLTEPDDKGTDPLDIAAARHLLPSVQPSADAVTALCAAGLAFGVPSLRIATLALRAAKACAALAGRDTVADADVELAAALVLAPRATTMPVAEQQDDEDDQAPAEPDDGPDQSPQDTRTDDESPSTPDEGQALTDRVVEATRAAIPAGLLADLSLAAAGARAPGAAGRAGIAKPALRGRPAGVRRGMPGHGARLAIVETLRAAAPWQPLRRAQLGTTTHRVLVRREDFRVGRFKQKSETLTLFVVDASGSAALHRLAEVKGAVELILVDCYARRDSVALIAFRGTKAELILPPTRSLVRAKRALAGQAGGGGTPIATAIESATLVAETAARKGQSPVVVLLTDGKANIGRSGQSGRAAAEADAIAAARGFRATRLAGLLLDIAPRPDDAARRLATAMGARYVPLPHADARTLSGAVLGMSQAGDRL